MGRHSGYDGLCRYLQQSGDVSGVSVWRKPQNGGMTPWRRLLSQTVRGTRFYDTMSLRAELTVMMRTLMHRPSVIHVLYAENGLGVLRRWRRIRNIPLVATVHQPPSWWIVGREPCWALGGVDAAIAVSRELANYFREHLGHRVHYVPHGVDAEFFCPLRDDAERTCGVPPRFVFVGVWMRDLAALVQVVGEVSARQPTWQFDLVVPAHCNDRERLKPLLPYPNVNWHSGLSDERLRDMYRKAAALVLPLIDCTCNNAVLEAMACGIPVISNRVGGMTDYVDEQCGDLVRVGDVAGLVSAVVRVGSSPSEQIERGKAARLHAMEHFGWDRIAHQTLAVYEAAIGYASGRESTARMVAVS
jgi:glycosyltransferase involved in cell wall biosynthesis